jgi:thiol-disulfide isomerase/thioredoxin
MVAKRGLVFMSGLLAGVLLLAAACGGGGDPGSATPAISPGEDGSLAGADPAPEFPGGHTWFNVSRPVTIADLRGKAVLLDFWTSGCVNCQHIIPDLERLEEEFPDELVVIGVHSGKYDREHEDESVRQAILRFGIEHPVVNDPDFVIWSAYGANAWPTLVLVDPAGNVVGGRSGEQVYDSFRDVIADLVAEFDGRGEIDRTAFALTDLEAGAVTSAFLAYPSAVLADEAGGRLFIADSGHNRVLISDLNGELQDSIGSGERGFDDGAFDEATLDDPQGLALSPDGSTLYISDTRNHALRTADLTSREVSTLSGTGNRAYRYPTPGVPAEGTDLASPWGLVLHEATLYIAMAGTHQIWTLDVEENTLAVFAGSGAEGIDDGPPPEATLAQPSGMTTDGTYLYWVDPESSSVRRVRLDGSGQVETLVGTGLFDFGDSDGVGLAARLEHPQGIVYSSGLLYLADTYNHKIRTVNPQTTEVRTVAGGVAGFTDGAGAEAALNEPAGLTLAGDRLYVADSANQVIRTFDLGSATVSTLALTNLAVAARGVEARTLMASLPAQVIAPATSSLVIRISSPEGFHLNSLAPSMLVLASSNEPALAPGESSVEWATDEISIELIVPVNVGGGDAILTAEGPVYYCRSGDEAICLIEEVDLALPVSIDPAAATGDLVLEYALPTPALQ